MLRTSRIASVYEGLGLLRASWEETAEACGTAAGSGAGGQAARVRSAPRLQADRDRSFDFALSEQASGRRATAPPAAGVGTATPAVRVSQVGLAIGREGHAMNHKKL
jgi:hypothetical protein